MCDVINNIWCLILMIITCFPMQNLLKCFAGLFWCMRSCCFLFCRSLPSFTTWVIIISFAAAMMWDVRIYNFKNEFRENEDVFLWALVHSSASKYIHFIFLWINSIISKGIRFMLQIFKNFDIFHGFFEYIRNPCTWWNIYGNSFIHIF